MPRYAAVNWAQEHVVAPFGSTYAVGYLLLYLSIHWFGLQDILQHPQVVHSIHPVGKIIYSSLGTTE